MTRKVLLAEIMHETNTFNRIATVKADFETRYWHEGMQAASALAGTNTEIAGFIEAAQNYDWSLEIPLAASASPSGPMAAADWDRVKQLILEPLQAGQQFDAVALVLHGSMVTETTLDAEGDLLREVRALAGADTLIAVTLDMHANVSPAMIEAADMMMAYRTYPHVDQRERALHMARLMEDVLQGAPRPELVMARMPMMDAANHGQTADGQPMPASAETGRNGGGSRRHHVCLDPDRISMVGRARHWPQCGCDGDRRPAGTRRGSGTHAGGVAKPP